MCKAFSCLVTRRKSVIWKAGIDSHDELFSMFQKKYHLKDDGVVKNYQQIEITPDEGYLHPEKHWTLNIDDSLCVWFTPRHEQTCFKALEKWKKQVYCFNLKEALNPFNPLSKERKRITKKELQLLKQWSSIHDSIDVSIYTSVYDSIYGSIYGSVYVSIYGSIYGSIDDSIYGSIYGSIYASVYDSIRDSIYGYIGSLFPNIKQWKYIKHKKGEYPYQSVVDLWYRGLVPSYDKYNKIWRIHTGKNAKIIWQGKIEDIK